MDDFSQLFVLQEFSLGEMDEKKFENFIMDRFQTRVSFVEELQVPDFYSETGVRSDLLFYIHDEDVLRSLEWRCQLGVCSWQELMEDEDACQDYPSELREKYPLQ